MCLRTTCNSFTKIIIHYNYSQHYASIIGSGLLSFTRGIIQVLIIVISLRMHRLFNLLNLPEKEAIEQFSQLMPYKSTKQQEEVKPYLYS